MLINLESIGVLDRFDFCVIGTGPAGLTVAQQLGSAGKRVLLLEGGGFDWSEDSQSFYQGDSTGDPYLALDESRLRYFGGSSGHWGGVCRALDAEDFKLKPGFADAHWPIRKSDLDPYLSVASRILEIPPIRPDRLLENSDIREMSFVMSPPVRFGEKYRDEIVASNRIFLALNANVDRLTPGEDGIDAVLVRSADGVAYELHAGNYILAAGGIENSRILLWSNEMGGGGAAPASTSLGRYWMEHPHFEVGYAIISENQLPEDRVFGVTPEARRRLGVLNCALFLQKAPYVGFRKMIADLACIAPSLGEWAAWQANMRLSCGAEISGVWEQAPNPASRIVLADAARDKFGIPRAELRWRFTDLEYKTVRETAMALGGYLAQADQGRVKIADWVLDGRGYPEFDAIGGNHHMGGTRMADDPAKGVVDRNCRAHGRSNLYISGSSVFPSAGHANPTLTIVQLALRLAAHLTK